LRLGGELAEKAQRVETGPPRSGISDHVSKIFPCGIVVNSSIAQSLLTATERLRKSGVPGARREAGFLLAHILGQDRTFLITHAEDLLGKPQLETFLEHVERRAMGEPTQYITGHQEFFGLDFEVNQNVLIPRPETELCVEIVLKLYPKSVTAPRICDLGTGSGCLAIALLHQLEDSEAVAIDISEAAIRVARRNAERHGVTSRLDFLVSDCFAAVAKDERFDVIVSNPPYVSGDALEGLQREVRDYEPLLALSPGGDGLLIIRRLLFESNNFLRRGGYLLIEIGFDQHKAVEQMIDRNIWRFLDIHQDLQGIPRTVLVQKISS